jgi:hypothetical protein
MLQALRCTRDGWRMSSIISSSRLRLISMRSSDAPPRGPCSQILTATSDRRWCRGVGSGVGRLVPGLHSSSSDGDGDIWLVARMTWLKVPWPSTLMARQRRRFPSYRPYASKYSARGCLLLLLDPDPIIEEESAALSDDSLGGGVGGFAIGVRPLASDRWGSRRICASAGVFKSAPPRVPDTVDVRLGISIGSGM